MKRCIRRGLAVAMGVVLLCTHPSGDARAKDRAKIFAISGAMSWGFISPDDVNRQLQFDNLSFAVALDDIKTLTEVDGELRYGISNRVTAEVQIGYLWQDVTDGRVNRRLSAFPLTASLVYFPITAKSRSLAALAGGGLLLETKLSGDDPLGRSSTSGSGYVVRAGLEFEQMISKLWAVRLRGLGQLAKAANVLPDGGTVDLSGGSFQIGLRAYFK